MADAKVFNDDAMRRIASSVRYVEQLQKVEQNQPVGPRRFVHLKEGKLDGALSTGGSATMSVYAKNAAGTWGDTGENITVEYPSGIGPAISSGKWLVVLWINGDWRPIASEC